MSIEKVLQQRCEQKCELCATPESLAIYEVPPEVNGFTAEQCVYLCNTCREQIEDHNKLDVHHWRCLNDSMWSQVPAVQVMAWRMLTRLRSEGWAQDLLNMLYLDDVTQTWAESAGEGNSSEANVKHVDSNGVMLAAGDTVTLIKDLNVKGASFTAKRGTSVRGISLVGDNAAHIEGRVNGQQIVILTKYVKKSS